MRLTNKFNLPQTFLNVLDRPTYSKGGANISATQLLNSPKIVALTKKYDDEIEQDASEMVWSIIGTAIHGVLEHAVMRTILLSKDYMQMWTAGTFLEP